jgi:hypothetical protein
MGSTAIKPEKKHHLHGSIMFYHHICWLQYYTHHQFIGSKGTWDIHISVPEMHS